MAQKFWDNAFKKGKAIGKFFRMTQVPENRVLVGKDRNGNSYFQHYDQNGFETKRECVYLDDYERFREIGEKSLDPFWGEWLSKRQKVPYSEQELSRLYREYDMRVNRFKNEKQMNDRQSNQHQNFKPGDWNK